MEGRSSIMTTPNRQQDDGTVDQVSADSNSWSLFSLPHHFSGNLFVDNRDFSSLSFHQHEQRNFSAPSSNSNPNHAATSSHDSSLALPFRKKSFINSRYGHLKDLSSLARWSLSSAKAGSGVDALFDESTTTYWQSDGSQPHTINALFIRAVRLHTIRIYLLFSADESYTPQKISIRIRSTFYEPWIEICTHAFDRPEGWVDIPCGGNVSNTANQDLDNATPLTRMLQIRIISNHQNGRDSHVRMLQVLGSTRATALKYRMNKTSMNPSRQTQNGKDADQSETGDGIGIKVHEPHHHKNTVVSSVDPMTQNKSLAEVAPPEKSPKNYVKYHSPSLAWGDDNPSFSSVEFFSKQMIR